MITFSLNHLTVGINLQELNHLVEEIERYKHQAAAKSETISSLNCSLSQLQSKYDDLCRTLEQEVKE
jgi:hypothetical protein